MDILRKDVKDLLQTPVFASTSLSVVTCCIELFGLFCVYTLLCVSLGPFWPSFLLFHLIMVVFVQAYVLLPRSYGNARLMAHMLWLVAATFFFFGLSDLFHHHWSPFLDESRAPLCALSFSLSGLHCLFRSVPRVALFVVGLSLVLLSVPVVAFASVRRRQYIDEGFRERQLRPLRDRERPALDQIARGY